MDKQAISPPLACLGTSSLCCRCTPPLTTLFMQGIDCFDDAGVTSISLSGVSASGPLPTSWSVTLPNLTSLDLSGNTLSGSLPDAWAAMTALTLLNLQGKCPSAAAPPLQL